MADGPILDKFQRPVHPTNKTVSLPITQLKSSENRAISRTYLFLSSTSKGSPGRMLINTHTCNILPIKPSTYNLNFQKKKLTKDPTSLPGQSSLDRPEEHESYYYPLCLPCLPICQGKPRATASWGLKLPSSPCFFQ